MKHKLLLLFSFLLICGIAQATPQARDILYWNGNEYHTIPLKQIEKHFSKEEVNNLKELEGVMTTTANYRGYRFVFEIDNDSLYLKSIVNDNDENIMESVLGSQKRRMMDSFSDTLFLGYGKAMYEPAFWTMVYESEITVVFKNGVVQWLKDNKNKSVSSPYYPPDIPFFKLLYSNIHWDSLDIKILHKKPSVVLNIEIDSIEKITITRSSGYKEFDDEAYRVCKSIPSPVSFVKGKYIHHSYHQAVFFDLEKVQKLGVKIESNLLESYQDNDNSEDQLLRMLEECIIKSKKEYESWESSGINMPQLWHPLVLCCDGLPNNPTKQNKSFNENIGLNTISWYNHKKFKKDLKKGLNVIEVHYYLKGNTFEVYVKFLTATDEGNEITLAYWFEDTNKYVYEYSCETGEWKFVKEE